MSCGLNMSDEKEYIEGLAQGFQFGRQWKNLENYIYTLMKDVEDFENHHRYYSYKVFDLWLKINDIFTTFKEIDSKNVETKLKNCFDQLQTLKKEYKKEKEKHYNRITTCQKRKRRHL